MAASAQSSEKRDRQLLLKASEVPEYLREVSILTGYRSSLSYYGCLKSIFCMHNETVNIWTHLLGFLYFLSLSCNNVLRGSPVARSQAEWFALHLQLFTYQICMLMSSLFHTFLCHSKQAKDNWKEADLMGILFALWGTYARIITTNFSCFPVSMFCHLMIVSLLFALVVVLKSGLLSTKNMKVELSVFLFLSLYAVAPFSHWIFVSPSLENNHVTSQVVAWMFFPYMLGAVGLFFYVSRIPERVVSIGKVDLCGASHQIWHVLIFLGMVSWYELTNWLAIHRPLTCQLMDVHLDTFNITNILYI